MPRSRKPQSDGSKPKVHVTYTGGQYVNPEELLRTPRVKDAINTMAQIAEREQRGRTDDTPDG